VSPEALRLPDKPSVAVLPFTSRSGDPDQEYFADGMVEEIIGGWLRGLGLERYEQAFRENEIDLRVLTKLTPDDLKELGVTEIGHRRRLIDAIGHINGGKCGCRGCSADPIRRTGGGRGRPAAANGHVL
jgi:hypothetical protein